MLKAQWVVNSTTYTLFSALPGSGNANINPLSNLIVAAASGGTAPATLYATPAQFASMSANISAATATVLNKLQPLLDKYQASQDPITGSFSANHTGLDLLFDNIQVTLTNGAANVSITDVNSGATLLSSSTTAINSALQAQLWGNQDAIIANDPDIAVDTNGRAIVVWAEQISGFYRIVARGPLDNTAVIISSPALNASAPKISIDGSGNAIAVWVQGNSSNTNSSIWGARYSTVTGWDAPLQISGSISNTNNFANVPQISMDSTGNAVAVWHAVNSSINTNHFDVYSSRYTAGSDSWSTPAVISSGTNTASNSHIALNTSGNGMAVWTEGQDDGTTSNGPMDVWTRRYSSANGWDGTIAKVNSIAGNVAGIYGQTALAVNINGNAVVAWVQGGIRAISFSPQNGWGTDTLIANHPTISGNCYSPDVAMDASGNAIAVWQQQDNISSSFTFANRFSGGTWSTALKISDDTSPFVADTHVRMGAAGNAIAVWYQPDTILNSSDFYSTVRSNRYTIGNGWGSATLVSTLLGIDGISSYPVPRIGMNSNGASFTVWGVDSM